MKAKLIHYLLKLFKTKRYILLVFVLLIFIYASISIIYINLNNHAAIDLKQSDIDVLRNRLSKLENSLDTIKNNADKLKLLINSNNNYYKEEIINKSNGNNMEKIGVLVISCNRPSVQYHLEQLLKGRKYNEKKFPIIVSQDCGHEQTKNAILKYNSTLFAYIQQPDLSNIVGPIAEHLVGYYKISRHYKFALDQVFMKYKFDKIIITEDDLNIADDFFQYFEATSNILDKDSTLFCVSAWNDNGKENCIENDPELLYRTDFFPGLGWMLKRDFWLEIRDKWPSGFWDDWLRDTKQRQNRSCIRPEISRSEISNRFGKFGVSNGQFFEQYLKYIVLNKKPVDWNKKDLSYLIKKNYDRIFIDKINSPALTDLNLQLYLNKDEKTTTLYNNANKIRFRYKSKQDFIKIAHHYTIMDDFKNGVPRTAYMGIVKLYSNSKHIYIVPEEWNGYDTSW